MHIQTFTAHVWANSRLIYWFKFSWCGFWSFWVHFILCWWNWKVSSNNFSEFDFFFSYIIWNRGIMLWHSCVFFFYSSQTVESRVFKVLCLSWLGQGQVVSDLVPTNLHGIGQVLVDWWDLTGYQYRVLKPWWRGCLVLLDNSNENPFIYASFFFFPLQYYPSLNRSRCCMKRICTGVLSSFSVLL